MPVDGKPRAQRCAGASKLCEGSPGGAQYLLQARPAGQSQGGRSLQGLSEQHSQGNLLQTTSAPILSPLGF